LKDPRKFCRDGWPGFAFEMKQRMRNRFERCKPAIFGLGTQPVCGWRSCWQSYAGQCVESGDPATHLAGLAPIAIGYDQDGPRWRRGAYPRINRHCIIGRKQQYCLFIGCDQLSEVRTFCSGLRCGAFAKHMHGCALQTGRRKHPCIRGFARFAIVHQQYEPATRGQRRQLIADAQRLVHVAALATQVGIFAAAHWRTMPCGSPDMDVMVLRNLGNVLVGKQSAPQVRY